MSEQLNEKGGLASQIDHPNVKHIIRMVLFSPEIKFSITLPVTAGGVQQRVSRGRDNGVQPLPYLNNDFHT